MKKILLTTCYLLLATCILAQLNTPKYTFTKADSLRGSNNENRNWWDVLRYDITVKPDFEKKEIEGVCKIIFKINYDYGYVKRSDGGYEILSYVIAQIDLQKGMFIDKVRFQENDYVNKKELNQQSNDETSSNNLCWLPFFGHDNLLLKNNIDSFIINFHGKPQEAKRAPWDGGWVWAKDSLGRPFVSVACQGLGASCWFPCKDFQGDEPDYGASLTVLVPDSLMVVGNGRYNKVEEYSAKKSLENSLNRIFKSPLEELASEKGLQLKTNGNYFQNPKGYTWQVKNPINSYCIVPYIGNYVNFTDTFIGEKGTLDLS